MEMCNVVKYEYYDLDEGDDIIVFINACMEIVNQVVDLYSDCGFKTTIEHVGDAEGAVFVKLVIARDGDDLQVYRRPDHMLLKLGWTKHKVTNP